jgi:hypothetical protein
MSFPLRPKTDTIQSNTASECESMIFAFEVCLSRFAMGGSRRSSFTWCATVDKIEDTKSREFSKVQQRSTSRPYLLETEATENRGFCARPESALGSGALSVCTSLDSTPWKTSLWNHAEPLATISTTLLARIAAMNCMSLILRYVRESDNSTRTCYRGRWSAGASQSRFAQFE